MVTKTQINEIHTYNVNYRYLQYIYWVEGDLGSIVGVSGDLRLLFFFYVNVFGMYPRLLLSS